VLNFVLLLGPCWRQ